MAAPVIEAGALGSPYRWFSNGRGRGRGRGMGMGMPSLSLSSASRLRLKPELVLAVLGLLVLLPGLPPPLLLLLLSLGEISSTLATVLRRRVR
jgi:hypothetical protein